MNKPMADAGQTPAADDIDQDSLEYLFGGHGQRSAKDVPWVKVAKEPEPVARISPAMIRLQAKVETLVAQLELVSTKLENANLQLGYTRAQLADKEEQLKVMAKYRARAAKAIMSDAEHVRLIDRIAELELQLEDMIDAGAATPFEVMEGRTNSLSADAEYYLYRAERCPAPGVPVMPVIYVSVVVFAALVLTTILI